MTWSLSVRVKCPRYTTSRGRKKNQLGERSHEKKKTFSLSPQMNTHMPTQVKTRGGNKTTRKNQGYPPMKKKVKEKNACK